MFLAELQLIHYYFTLFNFLLQKSYNKLFLLLMFVLQNINLINVWLQKEQTQTVSSVNRTHVEAQEHKFQFESLCLF